MFLLGSCAKIVMPTGGEKDMNPPKLASESPASGSVRMRNPVVKITFDEYFTLNNPTENILISPPMEQEPNYSIQGKTLVIKFKDTLKENTTYNMVFSNCIQDFHESNKLGYYHYSFSTGDEIDSFSLAGSVIDAQTLKPCDNMFVFLYDQDIDTLPMTSKPSYLTKTLSDGSFRFQNIRSGDYKIFALKDLNGNLLYDLPNETVAFAGHTFTAFYEAPKDTSDQTTPPQDTMPRIKLSAFVIQDTVPVLLRYENPAAGIYIFPYKAPVEEFSVIAIQHDVPHFETWNSKGDTVTWHLKEALTDTVSYIFIANGRTDTVQITPYKTKKAQSRGNKNAPVERLSVGVLNQGHRYKPLTLTFGYPVKPSDSITVTVCTQQKSGNDTAFYKISVPDTFITQLPLPIVFENKKNYTVTIPDSMFFGYNGLCNDSIKASFVTQSEKDYGSLSIEYVVPTSGFQYIAQLWSGNQLQQEDLLTASRTISYEHLLPGNYSITVIEDCNRNARWDAGDYHNMRQPENIYPYPKPISIRAYWDNEETFEIPVSKP
ncbi:MAG: Ig-like domain-containing protein [Bacteroidales bacterium]|nr:Ig-like domain-containing protein [Bacteroidales bacterium]